MSFVFDESQNCIEHTGAPTECGLIASSASYLHLKLECSRCCWWRQIGREWALAEVHVVECIWQVQERIIPMDTC